jgi:hypothetical protein
LQPVPTFLIDDLFQTCFDPSRAAMGFFGVKFW